MSHPHYLPTTKISIKKDILFGISIFLVYSFLTLPCNAQRLEFEIDAEENCISPTDSNSPSVAQAAVGVDKGSSRLDGKSMYKVSVSGEAYRGGGNIKGAVVFYLENGYREMDTVFLRPGESFIFMTPSSNRAFVEAAALDGGNIDDNRGSLTLSIERI
jgi:hypothetical protein